MTDLLGQALGENFLDKYKQAKTRVRLPKLNVTGETRNQLIEEIIKYFKPENESMLFRVGGVAYQVVLVETQDELQIFPPKMAWGGYRVSTKWHGSWLTCWLPEEDAKNLVPSTPYFMVGKLQAKDYNGKEQWSINAHGVITMQEIIAYKEAKAKQEAEINSKVSEHKSE